VLTDDRQLMIAGCSACGVASMQAAALTRQSRCVPFNLAAFERLKSDSCDQGAEMQIFTPAEGRVPDVASQ
jgi:hypothetical protein